jgi:hypothetical protein
MKHSTRFRLPNKPRQPIAAEDEEKGQTDDQDTGKKPGKTVPNATAIRLYRLVGHPTSPLDFLDTMEFLSIIKHMVRGVFITTLKTVCNKIA